MRGKRYKERELRKENMEEIKVEWEKREGRSESKDGGKRSWDKDKEIMARNIKIERWI